MCFQMRDALRVGCIGLSKWFFSLTMDKREMLKIMDDEIGHALNGRPCQAVLRKHRKKLEEVFLTYAAADKAITSGGLASANSINEAEWSEMINDSQLIDKNFTKREATMIFVVTNLQDELYSCKNFAEPMECTYDEFALMIGRLVREKVPPNPESTESFEETLNTYLELILLPTFKKTLIARKKARIG